MSKTHSKTISLILKLRESLDRLSKNVRMESTRTALRALIGEVDKLPRIASELFDSNEPDITISRPGAYPFASLQPGDFFDVEFDKVNSLRVCASSYARRHGILLTVRAKNNGGARCVRVDGLTDAPDCLVELAIKAGMPVVKKSAAAKPQVVAVAPAPASPVAPRKPNPFDEPWDRQPAQNTAFGVAQGVTAIEDPQTADEVRAAMAIPQEKRTEWQQVIVDDFQHLIEFENIRPASFEAKDAHDVPPAKRTPRQKWIAQFYVPPPPPLPIDEVKLDGLTMNSVPTRDQLRAIRAKDAGGRSDVEAYLHSEYGFVLDEE